MAETFVWIEMVVLGVLVLWHFGALVCWRFGELAVWVLALWRYGILQRITELVSRNSTKRW